MPRCIKRQDCLTLLLFSLLLSSLGLSDTKSMSLKYASHLTSHHHCDRDLVSRHRKIPPTNTHNPSRLHYDDTFCITEILKILRGHVLQSTPFRIHRGRSSHASPTPNHHTGARLPHARQPLATAQRSCLHAIHPQLVRCPRVTYPPGEVRQPRALRFNCAPARLSPPWPR